MSLLINPDNHDNHDDRLAAQMSFKFPQFVPSALSKVIPNASPEGLSLIQDLLKYDPQQRPTASQVLQYPFFMVNTYLPTADTSSGSNTSNTAFTRRPLQKPESEVRLEEIAAAKKVSHSILSYSILFYANDNLMILIFFFIGYDVYSYKNKLKKVKQSIQHHQKKFKWQHNNQEQNQHLFNIS